MKTLTKILTVVAVVALCVCLFTLTAFAVGADEVAEVYPAITANCFTEGRDAGFVMGDGRVFKGSATKGQIISDFSSYTAVASVDMLTTPKTAHSCSAETKVDSTCTTTGYSYYECANCGAHCTDASGTVEGENTIAMKAHQGTFSGGAVAATCDHTGLMAHGVCTVCGQLCDAGGNPTTQEALILPKTAHTFGAWTTLKDPTNVSPGQQVHVCTVCGEKEYQEIPALGITDAPYDLYYVIAVHDTWLRGEEPLTFESNLVEKLNAESGPSANYVGVRIGTDSLYENSYDTFDFWSWDKYIMLGEKTMQGLREGQYRIWVYDRRHPDEYTVSCDFWVVDVPTLEPYSTDKHVVNSSKSLRFVASDEIDPNSVMVGSKKLYDANDYFVSNDRKNITLSADFLNNRQTGTYTISARTKDGRTIKTNFYILTTAQASSSPRTGDESQIGLWAAFLLLSGAAVVVLLPKLRKSGVK